MLLYYFRSNCLQSFVLYDTRKLYSKFGEDWSVNNVTILSTNAGRTPDSPWIPDTLYILSNARHCIGQTNIRTPPSCGGPRRAPVQIVGSRRASFKKQRRYERLAATSQLSLTVAQCLSIHLSICVSVRDSLSHAYVRSIARREPRRLPACPFINPAVCVFVSVRHSSRLPKTRRCL